MQPVDAYNGSDPASMTADNTSGFNCRNAVGSVPPQWSVHAYGEAIDVNTVENPYLEGGTVMPPAGAAFLDRSNSVPAWRSPGGTRPGVRVGRLVLGRPLVLTRLPALLQVRAADSGPQVPG